MSDEKQQAIPGVKRQMPIWPQELRVECEEIWLRNARDEEMKRLFQGVVDQQQKRIAALQQECEVLRDKLTRAMGDLRNSEIMYVAMRNRCARTEEMVVAATAPVTDEEHRKNLWPMDSADVDALLAARRGKEQGDDDGSK